MGVTVTAFAILLIIFGNADRAIGLSMEVSATEQKSQSSEELLSGDLTYTISENNATITGYIVNGML